MMIVIHLKFFKFWINWFCFVLVHFSRDLMLKEGGRLWFKVLYPFFPSKLDFFLSRFNSCCNYWMKNIHFLPSQLHAPPLSLSLSLFLLLCFIVRIVSDEIKSWEAQQSTKECIYRAVIVAQLVDRSLPTQEVRSLNPAIGKIYWTYLNI